MLKIRLQGTTKDIKWFLKILGRDKRFTLENPSDIFSNKGTVIYKRLYAEIHRDDGLQNGKKHSEEKYGCKNNSNYYGSGRVFRDNSGKRKK